MLHLLMVDKNKVPDKFKLEREGLIYDAKIVQKNGVYSLDLSLNDYDNKTKLIENTDIFTWAIYMNGSKRKIYFSNNNKYIRKCTFSKGFISLSAVLNSYK